jgi:hypothetical protein
MGRENRSRERTADSLAEWRGWDRVALRVFAAGLLGALGAWVVLAMLGGRV